MLGVVADDLTGALDTALLLFSRGVMAPVVVGVEPFRQWGAPASTVILDVDSRGERPDEAYRKVREATSALRDAGYSRFYKKISSTFQGHVGPEVDAMMDETGAPFAIVVPAFPANGRTTRLGTLYVKGVPVSESGVGRHPTSPITDSYLPRVLQARTRRRVSLVTHDVVQRGAGALLAEFERLAGNGNGGIAVVDVTCQRDLEVVAEAARSLEVSSGGSALAGLLLQSEDRGVKTLPEAPVPALDGCLVLAGSVSPVTTAQVAWAVQNGVDALCLEVVALLDPVLRRGEIARATEFVLSRLGSGRDVLVHTPSDPDSRASAVELGEALGLGRLEVGNAVSAGLAEVAVMAVEATGLNRLIVAGGDTSSIVCRRLGLELHQVLEETQTGVPLSVSRGRYTMVTILKSGNFGSPDFFSHALARMRS